MRQEEGFTIILKASCPKILKLGSGVGAEIIEMSAVFLLSFKSGSKIHAVANDAWTQLQLWR